MMIHGKKITKKEKQLGGGAVDADDEHQMSVRNQRKRRNDRETKRKPRKDRHTDEEQAQK